VKFSSSVFLGDNLDILIVEPYKGLKGFFNGDETLHYRYNQIENKEFMINHGRNKWMHTKHCCRGKTKNELEN